MDENCASAPEGRSKLARGNAPGKVYSYNLNRSPGRGAVTRRYCAPAGALVIQVPPITVFLCAALAVALSVGIVGLAIGVGAVYATFDWETTAQLTANFGSLIFMMLSLGLVLVTIIPTSLLIMLNNIPGITEKLDRIDYLVAMCSASFLVFFINFATARWAMNVGAEALRRREI